MMENHTMEHIAPEELADYCAARVLEARAEAIEAHLAVCDACVEEARQSYAFAAIWEEWTGVTAGDLVAHPVRQSTLASQGDVAEQGVLQGALEQVQRQVDNPAWRARLAHWQTHRQGKAEAAARLVLEAADRTAQLLTEGLEALTTSGQAWSFALGAAPVRVRGRLGAAPVRVRGRGAQGQAPVPLTLQARLQVREATAGTRDLQLQVEALPSHQPPPLVLLIPIDTETLPLVAELMPTSDGMSFVARFREVPPGEYLIAVEPMSDAGT